jgi:hypothetical protein
MNDEQPVDPPALVGVETADQNGAGSPTQFAAVIDELRAGYRPGVPHDALPPAVVQHLAFCRTCAVEQGDDPHLAIPFASEADRDTWAAAHADDRRHTVTLARHSPGAGAGTTIVGRVDPGHPPAAEARGAAAVPGRPAPLLAFVVPEGGKPDMLCRIPNRAGAAWLLTAAHACLLGQQGSAGIPEPHRALYVGRITEHPKVFEIRIDGVIGALAPVFGLPIGDYFTVPRDTPLPGIEDAVEAGILDRHRLDRNLFSVVLMADAPPADPPDTDADTYLRERRHQHQHEQRQ